MESNYSILQNERNRRKKIKSRVLTLFLTLILIFLILMFFYTFYIIPYQKRIQEKTQIEEKYSLVFNNQKVDKIDFGNTSYSLKQGEIYYVYNSKIEIQFKLNQYDENKLKEVLSKNKIESTSIKVGIGYDKPAIFVKSLNNITYVFDYESYELIYYGELK